MRSLLPFLGDAFSWLTGRLTTKDVKSNLNKNQPIDCHTTQPTGDSSPHHLYSQCFHISHPGGQATYQHSNEWSRIDTLGCQNTSTTSHISYTAAWATSRLYSISPPSWQTSKILCPTWEKLPCTLWITLMQQQQEYSHHMYFLWQILEKCYYTLRTHFLPPCIYQFHQKMHSISNRYLCTHILIADEQFLLLIDVPIQDHAQQLEKYEVFNLAIPHRNFSACYSINNRYLGIMHDETRAVENFRRSIQHMPKGQWTVLQFKHTPSTTGQPTNLHISFICQGQS